MSSPPPLRTLQSASQQSANNKRAGDESPDDEASTRNGKRIKGVTQACKDCRRNKAKCDGTRPKCGPCAHKGRECGYEGEIGQSRQAAMKARLETLEKLFDSLQNRPPEDAERLLQRIRTADGLTSVLSIGGDDFADSTPPSSWPYEQNTVPPSSSAVSWRPGGSLYQLQTESSVDSVGSRRPPLSGGWSNFSGTSSPGSRQISDTSTLLIRLLLPNLSLTARAVDSFFASTGKLFHVFSRAQVAVFLDEIFGSGSPSVNPKEAVCCVACVAAVGVQYNAHDFDPRLDEVFYDVARHYFIDVFESQPLDSIKVCSLLAMFNIMNKSTISVAYVEVGLSMSRRHSLNDRNHVYSGLTAEEWSDYRATWRCLIFFSTWLSSTLGYIASEDVPLDTLLPAAEAEVGSSADITDAVQMEMTKISLLKADILRMHLAFKDLTGQAMESITKSLGDWYDSLPKAMLLVNLGQGDLPDSVRRSIYYVHLLYLGAIMLLYRRVASQFVRTFGVDYQRDTLWKPYEQLMLNHAAQGVIAAKTSSRVLGLLLGQTGCFKRCWVVIFQSYTSCVVLLHCVAQKQVHNMPASSWEEDLPQAKICLDALEYCGTIDPVALKFYDRLLPIYKTLSRRTSSSPPLSVPAGGSFSSSSTSSSATPAATGLPYPEYPPRQDSDPGPDPHPFAYLLTMPTTGDPESRELSLSLLKTLSRPYTNPADEDAAAKAVRDEYGSDDTAKLPQQQLFQSAACPQPSSLTHWDMQNSMTYRWTPTDLCIPDTIAGPAVMGVARFLGSTTPSGWSTAV